MARYQEYRYDRDSIAALVGKKPNTISQHVHRGLVDLSDLYSVVLYLAYQAPQQVRGRIAAAALLRPETKDPGGLKRKARERKARERKAR